VSIQLFLYKKANHQKISMVTCYDYPSAKLVGNTDIDCVLVGDSVAMTVHGFESTIHANIEMMCLHTQAVAKGIGKQFIVTDMPFLSHRKDKQTSIENALKLLQSGANAVKIEGADKFTCKQIQHLVESSVPVMGHIGLQPQSILTYGGYKVQGRQPEQAKRLIEEAKRLQEIGCFAIVLECIPALLASEISAQLRIPTIGIGAGAATDGQVLVWHDLLGLQKDLNPKFVKIYSETGHQMTDALQAFHEEVVKGVFPAQEHSFE
jgi:3-methyl-2-oxobutanoate hydroxymethyltransferase